MVTQFLFHSAMMGTDLSSFQKRATQCRILAGMLLVPEERETGHLVIVSGHRLSCRSGPVHWRTLQGA